MKEQIEEQVIMEMADDVRRIRESYFGQADYLFAKKLFEDGYRKQKHGTWYHGTENGAVYAKCSACGRKMNYSCYGYAYCSLCGARMDGAKMKGGAE